VATQGTEENDVYFDWGVKNSKNLGVSGKIDGGTRKGKSFPGGTDKPKGNCAGKTKGRGEQKQREARGVRSQKTTTNKTEGLKKKIDLVRKV